VVLPGIAVVRGPKAAASVEDADPAVLRLCDCLAAQTEKFAGVPLIGIVDDPDFAAQSLSNFLWVVFTRADPANDVHGAGAFVHRKHWGCRGPLIIDARLKPHMPPPLESDLAVSRRVDELFARGGPFQNIRE
jgi:4-hydroxy-3-polyprenylbenzoate decarboxylase